MGQIGLPCTPPPPPRTFWVFLLLGPPPISKVDAIKKKLEWTFDIGGGPSSKKNLVSDRPGGGGRPSWGGGHGNPIWPMDYKRTDRHLLRHRKPPQGIIIMLYVSCLHFRFRSIYRKPMNGFISYCTPIFLGDLDVPFEGYDLWPESLAPNCLFILIFLISGKPYQVARPLL